MERCRQRSRGQTLAETALALPLFVTLICGIIEGARIMYYEHEMATAAGAAARDLSLPSERDSDCRAIYDGTRSGNAMSIELDPHSREDETTGPSTPPIDEGYLYLSPAMTPPDQRGSVAGFDPSSAAAPPTTCSDPTWQRYSGPVFAKVTYTIKPWTPFFAAIVDHFTLTQTSEQQTEF